MLETWRIGWETQTQDGDSSIEVDKGGWGHQMRYRRLKGFGYLGAFNRSQCTGVLRRAEK